ncbi:universal stress protein [Phycisphaerales bacterium AB-hyl4]|uniref:Universal stress protein n=1 Tax=Natronomicrosphaera hydrolytica TaxID=3242702 RepID=A0ABV4U7X5_9BACT
MFQSLIVPLDGSTFGEHALPWATTLARRANAQLELVHVYEPLAPGDIQAPELTELNAQARQRAEAYLDDVVKRVASISSIKVQSSLLEGQVAERVLDRARAANTDLIVLTTHGRGPLSRLWLGSAADEMIRLTTIPLLVVRPEEDAPDLGNEPNMNKMLIPLDGSGFAEQILAPAVTMGKLMHSDCTLLRVVEPASSDHADSWFELSEQIDAELVEHGKSYLRTIATQLEQQTLSVKTRVATDWYPAKVILEHAQLQRISMISMATRGQSGLVRAFLGSVSDKVVRGASVPVLLHRPSSA